MKILTAIALGLISGLLINVLLCMLFFGGVDPAPVEFVLITFIGSWVVSAYVMAKNAKTVLKVFSRGFLIGAGEWLAMIPVGMFFSVNAAIQTDATSGAEKAGAAIGAGIVAFATGSFSIFMVLFCLVGFAISRYLSRELRVEERFDTATRLCPVCQETIKAQAQKCRFCNTELGSLSPVIGQNIRG